MTQIFQEIPQGAYFVVIDGEESPLYSKETYCDTKCSRISFSLSGTITFGPPTYLAPDTPVQVVSKELIGNQSG